MAPKFGTSGLRGLVRELTDDVIADHLQAFLASCDCGSGLYVARDLRPSSPRIARAAIAAARAAGVDVTDCGEVPTPALALAAMRAGAAALMVTGSHIPADRNGLKFYTPQGEITKADEQAILAQLGQRRAPVATGRLQPDHQSGASYINRYITAFGADALRGRRIGIYSHSAVGRDLLRTAFAGLGAEVVELGRAETFIAVDTEAVDAATRRQLQGWAQAASPRFDAIISTDGDGDRPLMTDARGQVIPGDILGQITASLLGADTVVTTVSANSGIELGGRIAQVIRCKIGSPYVIAAMEAATGRTIGYEPNGGLLLGFEAAGPAGPLPALMTRDSLLPLIAALVAAGKHSLAERIAQEPARFTATDRLQEVPSDISLALVERLTRDPQPLLGALGDRAQMHDLTDGLRLTLQSGRVIHLRPSGNAPELRLYTEAESPDQAWSLLNAGLLQLRRLIREIPPPETVRSKHSARMT